MEWPVKRRKKKSVVKAVVRPSRCLATVEARHCSAMYKHPLNYGYWIRPTASPGRAVDAFGLVAKDTILPICMSCVEGIDKYEVR